MQFEIPAGSPAWMAGRRRRLWLCLLAAAAFVVVLLSLLRMPSVAPLPPLERIEVRIPPAAERPEPEAPEPEVAEAEVPDPVSTPVAHVEAEEPPGNVPEDESDDEDVIAPPTDWDSIAQAEIVALADRLEANRSATFNTPMESRRREGALRYRPRTVPLPKPIWENVEVDQLGRNVLWSGDCYKVLDEPNVTRQVQFEIFDQYIVSCLWRKRIAKRLPWVKEVRDKYPYLSDPDGYLKGVDGPGDATSAVDDAAYAVVGE